MIKLGVCPLVMTGNHNTIVIPKNIDEAMPFEPAVEPPDYNITETGLEPKSSKKRRTRKKKNAE